MPAAAIKTAFWREGGGSEGAGSAGPGRRRTAAGQPDSLQRQQAVGDPSPPRLARVRWDGVAPGGRRRQAGGPGLGWCRQGWAWNVNANAQGSGC